MDESILRMLAKDPNARPGTAGAALAELERNFRKLPESYCNNLACRHVNIATALVLAMRSTMSKDRNHRGATSA